MKNHFFIYIAIICITFSFSGCDNGNEPQKEDVPELITAVTLTFKPVGGGTNIVVSATDPDGEGIQSIKTDGPVTLPKSTSYTMTITLINGLAEQNSPGWDVTAEVQQESDEHMFFFGWTGNAFADPAGNGNIDARGDKVNYGTSIDTKGLPLGLTTEWKTADVATTGQTFRIILKHQPGLKSATSSSNDGETDLDVTFPLTIQ